MLGSVFSLLKRIPRPAAARRAGGHLSGLLFISLLCFYSFPASSDTVCNWGFAGPKRFQCEGETYIHGSVACPGRPIPLKAFCAEDLYLLSDSACINDRSLKTLACLRQFTRAAEAEEAFPEGFCNWGYNGPKRFSCQGKEYVYGSTVCAKESYYQNIFCEARHSGSGAACLEDTAPDTIACYEACRLAGICS